MLIDARDLPNGHRLDADLCIVGAGAAGIALAREFLATRERVCLLESGAYRLEDATQALYDGVTRQTLTRHGVEEVQKEWDYLTRSRLRLFGGSTGTWGGWCRPLDELDFAPRPWVPHSGWPFPKATLDPYYPRACAIVRIAPFDYDADTRDVGGRRLLRLPDGSGLEHRFVHFSGPVYFGRDFFHVLADAPNIDLCLYANAVHLACVPGGQAIRHIDGATLTGRRFRVHARRYVLAAGGVENARLLLVSDDVHERGVGNAHDLVGRFFMEHPHAFAGTLYLPAPPERLDIYGERTLDAALGHTVLPIVGPTAAAQQAAGMLNASVQIIPAPFDPVITGVDRQVVTASHRLNRFLGRAADDYVCARLFVRSEQQPNPESRVRLTDDRDALGLRRVRLDWRLGDLDIDSMERAVHLLARACGAGFDGRAGCDIEQPVDVGSHHMGTTRMHVDPRHGVVDADLRVHGVDNLYVAGSSVFPTSGCANPTLTLLALACRLADHLRNDGAARA